METIEARNGLAAAVSLPMLFLSLAFPGILGCIATGQHTTNRQLFDGVADA